MKLKKNKEYVMYDNKKDTLVTVWLYEDFGCCIIDGVTRSIKFELPKHLTLIGVL